MTVTTTVGEVVLKLQVQITRGQSRDNSLEELAEKDSRKCWREMEGNVVHKGREIAVCWGLLGKVLRRRGNR